MNLQKSNDRFRNDPGAFFVPECLVYSESKAKGSNHSASTALTFGALVKCFVSLNNNTQDNIVMPGCGFLLHRICAQSMMNNLSQSVGEWL